MRMAWTVSATSCARMICTPPATARHAQASDAGSRAAASAPEQFSDKRFARNPEQQRALQLCKTPQAREQLQIVFGRLAKTDADVQHHLVRRDAGGVQSPQTLAEKAADFAHHIRVGRAACMVCGVPCMCMQT